MDLIKAFKANDIRGKYGKTINEDLYYAVGRSFVRFLKAKKVLVGRDLRASSPKLSKAFIRGVVEEGADAIDIGLVGTDVLYFASAKLNLPGVMITASHNPPEYNGIKFVNKGATPINQYNGFNEIKEFIIKNKFSKKKSGKTIKKDVLKDYVKHVQSFIDVRELKKIKVVIDAGYGMASKMIPLVYKNLPMEIIPLDFDLKNGKRTHIADPSKKKNVKHVKMKVCMTNSDFGMAFDGDTDRVFFINEKCKRVNSSITAGLMIKNLFKHGKPKSKKIVYSSVMSKTIPEISKRYGGKAFKERVGHTFIKARMRKENAVFGCEHSGHFYYKDNFYADSGIITSLIMCEIFSKQKGKFSDMVKEFETTSKGYEQSVRVDDQEKTMQKVKKHYKRKAKIEHFDGIRISFKDWWVNIRKSNTEPLLRVNVEAQNIKLLKAKKKEVLKIIKKFN